MARFVEVAASISLLAVLGLVSLRERQFLLVDDAYIAFRYAANFADGQGLVWNPGEHVEGYTNLLWVLLLSAVSKVRLDLTVPAVIASFSFASASLVLTARIAGLADTESRWSRLLPPLLLASNASFVNAATSGMESTAFGFFSLLGIHTLVRARERPRLRALSALAFCLACLTRPEGALVTATALATEFVTTPGPATARTQRLAPVAGAVALVVGTHMAARLAYYGYPFPNTFYAKVIFGSWTVIRGIAHVIGFMLAGGVATLPGLKELGRPSPSRPWFVHGYSLLLAYIAYLVLIGGDLPQWYRFYVPLLPLPFVASGHLVGRILGAARKAGPRAIRALATALPFAALCGVGALGYAFGERQQFIVGRITREQKQLVARMTAFFQDEVPPRSLVAVQAVGYVGYYARTLRILDMWGLNDRHIAHMDMPPTAMFGHDKYDFAYVAQVRPDYVYAFLPPAPFGGVLAPPPIGGYDLCWPTRYPPVVVYRRSVPLEPHERGLGVVAPFKRYLAPPPACLPP